MIFIKTKNYFGVLAFCAILLIGVVLIIGCVKSSPTEEETLTPIDSPQLPSRGFFMGLWPSPAQYSEFVSVWGRPTPFYNLASDLNGEWGRIFLKQLIRDNGMFPIIHLSFIDTNLILVIPPGLENASLSSPEWRAKYKKAVLDVVKASRPLYLSLGNEVNKWYEKYGLDGPNGFKHFVSLYEEIYDEVKNIYTEIIVFCVFAREMVSENREADLEVLRLFNSEKMDLLVFTSYPYALGWTNPSMIPDDYYLKAVDYMPNKPFGFSEIAWPSLDAQGGEQAQADFIVQATRRLTKDRGINLYLFGWPWLHDLGNEAVGLIKKDGTEKLAYETWKSISGR